MKAMILAAGRGERLRPLTDHIPKPLIEVNGKALIDYHIEKLIAAGIREIVINTAWLGEQIAQHVLAKQNTANTRIILSQETDGALETAGGIVQALDHLGDDNFILVSADIYNLFDYKQLVATSLPDDCLAHLLLVTNPSHHPEGDFALTETGLLQCSGKEKFTYSGVGLFKPALFTELPPGKRAIAPILRAAMTQNLIRGEVSEQFWTDVGTAQRLSELNKVVTNGIV